MNLQPRPHFFVRHPWLFDLLVAFVFAVLVCLFSSTATSPLYPAENYDYINLDSNFFLYFAEMVLYHGKTPYLDIYDHKGMGHIFVDMVGLFLGQGSRYGVWALEILFTFVSVLFLLRSVRLLFGDQLRFRLFALAFYAPLVAMAAMGNSEGEWILPFVTFALYFYLQGYIENRRSAFFLGSLFSGIEVGLALNSRPLDALWGGCFVVFYFVYYLQKQKNWDLLWNVLGAILGCGVIFSFFIAVAFKDGYLGVMYEAIYVQSWAYLQKQIPLLSIWLNRLLIAAILASVIVFYLRERKVFQNQKTLNQFFLIVGLISSVLYFVIARFTSYYYSGYTFYILGLAYYLSSFKPLLNHPRVTALKTASLTLTALEVVWCAALVGGYYGSGLADFSYQKSKDIETTILHTIPASDRQSEGKVFALNCDAMVYRVGGIVAKERYCINQTWWAYDNPGVIPEVKDYLSGNDKPKWLLVSTNPETLESYGDVVETYYQPTATANEEFVIYLRK